MGAIIAVLAALFEKTALCTHRRREKPIPSSRRLTRVDAARREASSTGSFPITTCPKPLLARHSTSLSFARELDVRARFSVSGLRDRKNHPCRKKRLTILESAGEDGENSYRREIARHRQWVTAVMPPSHSVTIEVKRAVRTLFDWRRLYFFTIAASGDDHRRPPWFGSLGWAEIKIQKSCCQSYQKQISHGVNILLDPIGKTRQSGSPGPHRDEATK